MIAPEDMVVKAKRKETENLRFRIWLKNHADEDELDHRFKQLHEKLFADYDCCKCANCCRLYETGMEAEEVERVAEYLQMPLKAFEDAYIQINKEEGVPVFPAPCPMLEPDGKCRIQACKPKECLGFPYTDRPDRIGSLYSVMQNASICPVVHEIVERLKQMYRFRSRR